MPPKKNPRAGSEVPEPSGTRRDDSPEFPIETPLPPIEEEPQEPVRHRTIEREQSLVNEPTASLTEAIQLMTNELCRRENPARKSKSKRARHIRRL